VTRLARVKSAHGHGHGHAHAHAHTDEHGHGHGHAHAHAEEHAHVHEDGVGRFTPEEERQAGRLRLVLWIVGGFFVVELAGALAAQSVVLQAEAAHLLMDVLALGVSLLAMRVAVRRPTARFTFGLRRAEPVAAIFSGLLVLVTTGLIVAEAIEALRGGSPPRATIMIVVAVAALGVNGVSAWLLHGAVGHAGHAHGDPDNPEDHGHGDRRAGGGHALNLRGASLHLLGDALGAVAALVAAVVIRFWGYAVADPMASFVVAAILLVGSVRLLRDATLVLLEAAPPHLPVRTIREVIVGLPGVLEVHDLHVWTLGAGHDAITVHVRTASQDPGFGQDLARRIRTLLGAEYVTVQTEVGGVRGGAERLAGGKREGPA
jgi:cobalt-zinc-cadmium efflux system protein